VSVTVWMGPKNIAPPGFELRTVQPVYNKKVSTSLPHNMFMCYDDSQNKHRLFPVHATFPAHPPYTLLVSSEYKL